MAGPRHPRHGTRDPGKGARARYETVPSPDDPATLVKAVSVRQLSKHATEIVNEVENAGVTLLVLHNGEPVAWLVPSAAKTLQEG